MQLPHWYLLRSSVLLLLWSSSTVTLEYPCRYSKRRYCIVTVEILQKSSTVISVSVHGNCVSDYHIAGHGNLAVYCTVTPTYPSSRNESLKASHENLDVYRVVLVQAWWFNSQNELNFARPFKCKLYIAFLFFKVVKWKHNWVLHCSNVNTSLQNRKNRAILFHCLEEEWDPSKFSHAASIIVFYPKPMLMFETNTNSS